jgi:uncharacterized protein Usg
LEYIIYFCFLRHFVKVSETDSGVKLCFIPFKEEHMIEKPVSLAPSSPVKLAPDVDPAFRRQLEGYGLTTANILYHMPDHPHLLQAFIWQEYDVFPNFPVLNRFIDFWKREIEGALHSVRVAHSRLITPAELSAIGAEFRLN